MRGPLISSVASHTTDPLVRLEVPGSENPGLQIRVDLCLDCGVVPAVGDAGAAVDSDADLAVGVEMERAENARLHVNPDVAVDRRIVGTVRDVELGVDGHASDTKSKNSQEHSRSPFTFLYDLFSQ